MSTYELDDTPDGIPVEEMTFEDAFSALEAVVNRLEGGKYSLAQAVELFEHGQELAKHCAALLDGAELKVEQLTGDTLVPFEPQE
jgi:exodeoxyribonuclease VII small subunit